jgi:hypothetical protein
MPADTLETHGGVHRDHGKNIAKKLQQSSIPTLVLFSVPPFLSLSLSLFLSSLFLVGIKSGSGKVGGIFRAETETIPSDRKMICTERKAAPFRLKISYIFNMSRAR